MIASREGWPAALDEIESLKRQLQVAAIGSKGCPFYQTESFMKDKCRDCDKTDKNEVDCWREYWRQKSGTFQNGNNHGTTSKTETVGEGAK